ncbi:MAG: cation-translocating P-type ATPase [Clostridia bacterium]|nr:cation-translocating P-type ATPase [Clostridia bacterium]
MTNEEYTVDEILRQAQANRQQRQAEEEAKKAEKVEPAAPPESAAAPLPDPEEEEVRIYVPSARTERPADGDTRVLETKPARSPADETVRIVLANGRSERVRVEPEDIFSDSRQQPFDGQVTLEELVAEAAPDPSETAAQDTPQEQPPVQPEEPSDFSFQKEKNYSGFKFSGDEEENDPEEEPEQTQEQVLDDYTDPADAPTVMHELRYRRRTGLFSLTMTGIFEFILLGMLGVCYLSGALPLEPGVFVTLNALFLLAMMAISHRTIGKGLTGLLRRRGGVDSAVTLVVLTALLHTLLQYGCLAELTVTTPALAVIGGFALLLSVLSKQLRLSRLCAGFRFLQDGQLYAATAVEDERTAVDVGRAAVPVGIPRVAYYKKAGFLSRFLETSYAENPLDRLMAVLVPAAAGVSLLLGLVYGLLHAGFFDGLTVFACSVCMTVPCACTLALSVPFTRAAFRLLRHGGLIAGWPAVEKFGRTQALVLDAEQLFPGECVLLHGIKAYAGSAIDEVILDAAAVSIRAGGPLSHVFRRVIQDKVDMLRDVDTLVYEQEMGLSGWVAGRRVLVGNSRLMINHGVDVPSKDYESKYAHSGRQLVYLSVGGALSGMFIVSYAADPSIAAALKELNRRHVTLLVRSTDPNVTEEMICSLYGTDRYHTGVLSASAGRTYDQLVLEQEDTVPAALASNGRLDGEATGVSVCRRLSEASRMAQVLQTVLSVIGFILAAVAAFLAPAQQWGLVPVYILVYMLFGCLVSTALPLLSRHS